MAVSLEGLASLGQTQVEDPYPPFPVKIEAGMIEDPSKKAQPLEDPAGVLLASGFLPNPALSGLVQFGRDYAAFDHVALEGDRNKLVIKPTSKGVVAPDGYINDEGLVVISQPNGLLKIAAVAVNTTRHPWLAERLRSSARPWRTDNEVAVFLPRAFALPLFEITDVDRLNYSVTAIPTDILA